MSEVSEYGFLRAMCKKEYGSHQKNGAIPVNIMWAPKGGNIEWAIRSWVNNPSPTEIDETTTRYQIIIEVRGRIDEALEFRWYPKCRAKPKNPNIDKPINPDQIYWNIVPIPWERITVVHNPHNLQL